MLIWMDGSPLTFAMWNDGIYAEATPLKLKTQNIMQDKAQEYSSLVRALMIAKKTIFPQRSQDLNCSLTYIPLSRKMVWIQIPCSKMILGDWICKRSLKKRRRNWNPLLCPKRW